MSAFKLMMIAALMVAVIVLYILEHDGSDGGGR